MAYNPQEQEQIDELKALWAKYGNLLLALVTIALFAYAGVKGWAWYQARQAAAASGAYSQLTAAIEAKDLEKIRATSKAVMSDYGGTVYGQMAGLVAARGLHDGKDLAGAKQSLQWVVDKAPDAEFRLLARLRLAGLLLDEKRYDDALSMLATPELEAAAAELKAAFAERAGDIQYARGKGEDAKAEYEKALGLLNPGSALRAGIELKRDTALLPVPDATSVAASPAAAK
ncbi:MAG: YfgM family protein [Lautropia sp.]